MHLDSGPWEPSAQTITPGAGRERHSSQNNHQQCSIDTLVRLNNSIEGLTRQQTRILKVSFLPHIDSYHCFRNAQGQGVEDAFHFLTPIRDLHSLLGTVKEDAIPHTHCPPCRVNRPHWTCGCGTNGLFSPFVTRECAFYSAMSPPHPTPSSSPTRRTSVSPTQYKGLPGASTSPRWPPPPPSSPSSSRSDCSYFTLPTHTRTSVDIQGGPMDPSSPIAGRHQPPSSDQPSL